MNSRIFVLPILFIVGILLFANCNSGNKKDENNKVETSDWVWLFDGTSIDAWQGAHFEGFPDNGWRADGDVLTVLAKTDSTPAGKDIISKNQYSNFELELEIRLTPGANSGIKYFVMNDFPGNEGQYLGLEYQLIDDKRHADAKLGNNGNRTMASLYDLIPAAKDKEVNPPGQWNKVKIIVDENHVEHLLNEQQILEFNRKSDAFRQLIAISKYKDYKEFGEIPAGHILLQGHNDEVSFRAIRIRTW